MTTREPYNWPTGPSQAIRDIEADFARLRARYGYLIGGGGFPMYNRIAHLPPTPIFVAAHIEPQLERFRVTFGLRRKEVLRVLSPRDLSTGRVRRNTLVLLPGWWLGRQTSEAVEIWKRLGGQVMELSEDDVLGNIAHLTEAPPR